MNQIPIDSPRRGQERISSLHSMCQNLQSELQEAGVPLPVGFSRLRESLSSGHTFRQRSVFRSVWSKEERRTGKRQHEPFVFRKFDVSKHRKIGEKSALKKRKATPCKKSLPLRKQFPCGKHEKGPITCTKKQER